MTQEPSPEQQAEQRMRDALGPEMADDAVQASGAVVRRPEGSVVPKLLVAIGVIVALQVAAWFVFPPFDPRAEVDEFRFPESGIWANFELPAPHVVFDLVPATDPQHPRELPTDIVTVDPTIPSSVFTGWIVAGVLLVLAFVLSRRVQVVPGRRQNALEYVYEGLANFATSLGGPEARRYVPVFVAFFIFILASNWSGLLPFVGRTHELRAPTSDVNVTIGLALVAFSMFHIEGVRRLGFRGYFGKFFSLRGFRDGIGAGVIGLFVGALEFLLEFVKPVTLSMRLFGNIYAGEIALGVISALTIFVVPVLMFGLEVLLNFMQALIFSVLALMFTIAAIEAHHEEHDEEHREHRPEPELPEGNIQPEVNGQVAHA